MAISFRCVVFKDRHPYIKGELSFKRRSVSWTMNLLWAYITGFFFLYAIEYCKIEFKLRYLKNVTLFSVRKRELFEPRPIVLQRKADGLCPFQKYFS